MKNISLVGYFWIRKELNTRKKRKKLVEIQKTGEKAESELYF